MTRALLWRTSALLFVAAAPAMAQPCGTPLALQPVTGLTGSHVAISSDPSDATRMLSLDLNGQVRSFRTNASTIVTTLTLTGSAGGGGGYGMTFDPNFASTGHLYIFFPTGSTSSVLRFTRSSSNPELFDPTSRTVILQIPSSPTQHTGGWIGFGPDGYLYVAVGDHFNSANAQNPAVLMGKLLRIDVRSDGFPADANRNYAIPSDNPFVGGTTPPEIVCRGLRNPFRCFFDDQTGALFIADVGGGQREEVNRITPGIMLGQNFGWPCREGFIQGSSTGACASPPIFTDPVVDFTRTQMTCITGGLLYRGAAIPSLQGRFLVASCAGTGRFFSFHPSVPIPSLTLHSGIATSIYCFAEDASGEVYVGLQSGIAKVVAGAPPSPDCNGNRIMDSCEIALRTETDFNANAIPDSCERACLADFNASGTLEIQDVLDFINLWFQGYLATDLDGDGLDLQDLFDFLNAWFGGCP